MIAEAVKLEGQAEKELQKGFAQKRQHEQIMEKINAIETFASNKNSVVFGEQGGNLMAQVETFKMVKHWAIKYYSIWDSWRNSSSILNH